MNGLTRSFEALLMTDVNRDAMDVQAILSQFDSIRTDTPLTTSDVCAIVAVKCLMDIYSQWLVHPDTISPVITKLRPLLSNNRTTLPTLHLYTLKRLVFTQGFSQEQLEAFVSGVKDPWAAAFVQDFKASRTVKPPNSECYFIPSKTAYHSLNDHFDSFYANKPSPMTALLTQLQTSKDRMTLAGYYCQLINRFYLTPNNPNSRHKDYLSEIGKSKDQFISVFGQTGLTFVTSLLTNFTPTGPLRYLPTDSQEAIRRKVSSLFAFALLLSLKNEPTYLSKLLWTDNCQSIDPSKPPHSLVHHVPPRNDHPRGPFHCPHDHPSSNPHHHLGRRQGLPWLYRPKNKSGNALPIATSFSPLKTADSQTTPTARPVLFARVKSARSPTARLFPITLVTPESTPKGSLTRRLTSSGTTTPRASSTLPFPSPKSTWNPSTSPKAPQHPQFPDQLSRPRPFRHPLSSHSHLSNHSRNSSRQFPKIIYRKNQPKLFDA